MKPIKDGDRLPPFPFQAVCVDNSGREDLLVKGKTYTVIMSSGWAGRTPCVAGPDLILQGIDFTFSIRRFHIGPPDLSDWRTWRDHGLEPGHCVCRTPRELCWIHRD